MELSHTRQSDDMATPHTPIVILLSHLQALSDFIILTFVIAMSLFPGALVLSAKSFLNSFNEVF